MMIGRDEAVRGPLKEAGFLRDDIVEMPRLISPETRGPNSWPEVPNDVATYYTQVEDCGCTQLKKVEFKLQEISTYSSCARLP